MTNPELRLRVKALRDEISGLMDELGEKAPGTVPWICLAAARDMMFAVIAWTYECQKNEVRNAAQ